MPREPSNRRSVELRPTNDILRQSLGPLTDSAILRRQIAQLEAELAAAAALEALEASRPRGPGAPSRAASTRRDITGANAGLVAPHYGVITLEAGGRIVACDDEAVRIFGLSSAADIVNQRVSVLYPPSDCDVNKAERNLALAAAHGPWEEEDRRVRASGEPFWALVTIFALRHDRGDLSGFIMLVRDVTLRRRDEERRRLMTDITLNAMVLINERGGIVMVNPQTEKMFGYAADELLGQPIEVLVPEQFRQHHPAYRQAFFSSPTVRAMGGGRDLYGRRKDGSQFAVEIGLNPIQTDDGLLVVGSVVDITERRRAEEKFRLAVESAPSAMVMVNRRGEIVLVNLQTERLFGYAREALLGQPIELLVPERFCGRHPGFRDLFFAHPVARPMGVGRDLHGRRQDGSEFPVEIGLTPIETEDGLLVLSAIVDITERKLAEERARRHVAEMAHAGRLSTIGELFSGLAHEVNQPLAAAANYARACVRFAQSEQGASKEQLIEWMEKAAAQASRAAEIVQRVGRFVKREQAAAHAALDVNRIIEHVGSLPLLEVWPADGAGRIVPELLLAPALPPALGDRVQIEQVLVNLIRNAMEAMVDTPADRWRLIVQTVALGQSIQVSVSDRGHGITEQQMSQLFSPFFTTKTNGLGLGLSISRSILESHSGRLWAESNAEGGATFLFSLPILIEEGNS